MKSHEVQISNLFLRKTLADRFSCDKHDRSFLLKNPDKAEQLSLGTDVAGKLSIFLHIMRKIGKLFYVFAKIFLLTMHLACFLY